jgi:hypothetical protein
VAQAPNGFPCVSTGHYFKRKLVKPPVEAQVSNAFSWSKAPTTVENNALSVRLEEDVAISRRIPSVRLEIGHAAISEVNIRNV